MTEQIKDLIDCTPEELNGVYETYHLSFEYYGLPFDEAKQRTLIDSLMKAPWFHGLVHLADGAVTSFLFYIDSYSSIQASAKIRIEEIFVKEDKRNSGIGKKLIKKIKDNARASGVAVIELNTEANNPDMLRFYVGAGFKSVPHTPLQLKIEHTD